VLTPNLLDVQAACRDNHTTRTHPMMTRPIRELTTPYRFILMNG